MYTLKNAPPTWKIWSSNMEQPVCQQCLFYMHATHLKKHRGFTVTPVQFAPGTPVCSYVWPRPGSAVS